jgi:hypothetical protein
LAVTGGTELATCCVATRSAEGQELALVPIAIELKHKQTQAQEAAAGRTLPDTAGIVYSRQQLKKDANGQVRRITVMQAGY